MTSAVLHTLQYFDLFKHPLTSEEVFLFLQESCDKGDVDKALRELVSNGEVQQEGDLYQLTSKENHFSIRHERQSRALRMIDESRRFAKIIASFPFVRGIGISGSTSKLSAPEDADLDFFIITAQDRLWIARTLLHLFKKLTFLTGHEHKFCMNYFVDEAHLTLPYPNVYTALELMTLIPVFGEETVERLRHENGWTKQHLPNHTGQPLAKAQIVKPLGFIKSFGEVLLNILLPVRLNLGLMNLTDWKWRRKFKHLNLSEEAYERALLTKPHISKNHPKDFQKLILSQWKANKEGESRMKILLTGASGYIGRAVMEELIGREDIHLTVLRHRSSVTASEDVEYLDGGLEKLNSDYLQRLQPDVIIHLARPTFPKWRWLGRKLAGWYGSQLNQNLIKTLERSLPHTRLIYVSGSLMYGQSNGVPHDESAPLATISFARAYVNAEQPFLKTLSNGNQQITLLRAPWVLGAGSWFDWVYVKHYRDHKSIPLFGSGDNHMHFIHLRDLAKSIVSCAEKSEIKGIRNVFSPDVLPQRDFAQLLSQELNCAIDSSVGKYEADLQEAFSSNIVLSTNHSDLDALPARDLRQEVRSLLGLLKDK